MQPEEEMGYGGGGSVLQLYCPYERVYAFRAESEEESLTLTPI